jgi:hypothetical protein
MACKFESDITNLNRVQMNACMYAYMFVNVTMHIPSTQGTSLGCKALTIMQGHNSCQCMEMKRLVLEGIETANVYEQIPSTAIFAPASVKNKT